jgi:predicted ArsR family transcriptional regulator
MLEEILREVGRSIAGDQTPRGDLESRIAKAVSAREAIGGTARLEKEGEKLLVKGGSCPLATAVAEHPEVCQLTEALLSEIIGAKVQERCDREGSPRCRFEIIEK